MLEHGLRGRAPDEESPKAADPPAALEFCLVGLHDVGLLKHASVEDRDAQRSVALRLGKQVFDLRRIRGVALHTDDLAGAGSRCVGRRLAACCGEHAVPLFRKDVDQCRTEPGSDAYYDCRFVLHLHFLLDQGNQRKSRDLAASVPSQRLRSMKRAAITCITSPCRCSSPCTSSRRASRKCRRCASATPGQTIRFTWPVSSSRVMKMTPLALDGRWRVMTSPAVLTRVPCAIVLRSLAVWR